MMCVITEFIGSTRQYMVLIVKDKDQSAVRGLWDDNSIIFFQHALLKDQVSASRGYHALFSIRLVHLSDLVGVYTGTVDNDLGFDIEFFAFWIHLIDAGSADNLAIFVLNEPL